jgi:hypothetical protein
VQQSVRKRFPELKANGDQNHRISLAVGMILKTKTIKMATVANRQKQIEYQEIRMWLRYAVLKESQSK